MDPLTIFQRTESGRETIKRKSRKLTQSERLLLIIINGVTPYDVLRKEVWSLSEDRFDRALRKLLKEELIEEVLLPVANQEAEQLDSMEVDRFLQQDPLDPVTIISFDPEDEFGIDVNPFSSFPATSNEKEADANATAFPAALQSEPTAAAMPLPPPSENSDAGAQPATGAAVEQSAALKSLSMQLAQDGNEERAGFFQVPVPAPALANALHSSELEAELPDDWPEPAAANVPDVSPRLVWIYWVALIGGIGIVVSSLVLNALR